MKGTSETSSGLTGSTSLSRWLLQIIKFQKSSRIEIGHHERGTESLERGPHEIDHAKMTRSIGGNVVPRHRMIG